MAGPGSDEAGANPASGDEPNSGNQPTTTRRRSLRAIFAADIAGFSGRMSLNETSTVNALSEIRAIGRRELEVHHGWLFGMPGDGLFALFESAVSAVECALSLQHEMAQRPYLADTPLRIGVHLGEVLIDNELPYGEALNIAARLEALADPGGIMVSGTVMDAVSARISATFEDRGVPILKNIPRRIPTFAVSPPPARSPTDETQSGLSTLDRTTPLDRQALRQIRDEHATVDIVEPAGSPIEVAPPSATPDLPIFPEVDLAKAAATGREQMNKSDAIQPPSVLVDVALPPESDFEPAPLPSTETTEPDPAIASSLPANEPDALKTNTASLAERLDGLPATASLPESPPTSSSAPPPHAPIIQTAPLEKTLPEVSELTDLGVQEVPPIDGAEQPSEAFIDEITKALAIHLGPLSKLIVEREMKAQPSAFELVTLLEKHVPTEDERLVFRVRASHINSSKNDMDDERD